MSRSNVIEPLEARQMFSAATAGWGIHPVTSATANDSDIHHAARPSALTAPALARPAVSDVQVNDGDPQRSMVNSLTVTFDRAVFRNDGAITLTGRNGAGAGTGTVLANPSGDHRTFVLTFSGTPVVGGSLADGIYDLRVVASKVHAGTVNGVSMAANFSFAFHRLYADAQGNKSVNAQDFGVFRTTFGTSSGQAGYKWYFDYDANGVINNLDFNHFRQEFGNSFAY